MRFILSFLFCLVLSFTVYAQNSNKPLAENFTAATLNGRNISLEELRGKVVVLTFWSTRCPICNSEMPKYNQLAAKYAGQNVVFLGLSMENEAMINNYIKKRPFNFTLIPNSLGIIMQYALKNKSGGYEIGYPTHFVINQKGEIELKASGRGKVGAVDSLVGRLLTSG
jgi:peroxiredoxin